MIEIYIGTMYKQNKTALRYGLGNYLSMLKYAIKYHPDMEIVNKPELADVIHLHDIFSSTLFSKFQKYGKPIIAQFHTLKYGKDFVYAVENSDLVVFVSKYLANSYNIKNSKVVYNGIKPSKLIRSIVRPIDFIVTSRVSDMKGLELITNNKCEDYIAVSTGEAKIKGFKNMGYLPFKEYNALLSQSKIHILPSFFEPFGLATLYAMSQGAIPAISTHSGVSEIVPDDISIKFSPENVSLNMLYEIYAAKSLYELRDEVISFARAHDYRWYADEIYGVYKEVIK